MERGEITPFVDVFKTMAAGVDAVEAGLSAVGSQVIQIYTAISDYLGTVLDQVLEFVMILYKGLWRFCDSIFSFFGGSCPLPPPWF